MFNLAILFDLSLLLASFYNSNLRTEVDETDKSTPQAQTPILADKCPQNRKIMFRRVLGGDVISTQHPTLYGIALTALTFIPVIA